MDCFVFCIGLFVAYILFTHPYPVDYQKDDDDVCDDFE